MEPAQKEKSLELDRLVFFSDAVVAIAITLLALELKVEPSGEHLHFKDFLNTWHQFAAFFLSFLMIAVFWIIHHRFFVFIKHIDQRVLIYNIGWLLFIVLLPFSSSLISDHFFDKTAMCIYSVNILAITCFQNLIWDYSTDNKELLKDSVTNEIINEYRTACNIAMGNAIIAIAVAFFSPVIAFIILFTRTIMFRLSAKQFELRRRKKMAKRQ